MKEIIIRAKEMSTKEGKKFLVFNAKTKEGKWIKLKFRKDTTETPRESGWFMLMCEAENMSLSQDDFGNVLWVGGETEIREYERKQDPRIDDMF